MEGIFFEQAVPIDRLNEASFFHAANVESFALNGGACLKQCGHKFADVSENFLLVGACLHAWDLKFFMTCTEFGDFAG